MDNYIIILKNGKTENVTCDYTIQKDGMIRFVKQREYLLDQRLKGPDVVISVNQNEIRYFKKVTA